MTAEDFLTCIDFEYNFSCNKLDIRIDEIIAKSRKTFPDNIKIHCANLRSLLNKVWERKENLERVRSTLSDGMQKFEHSVDFYYEFLVAIDQYAFAIPMQEEIVRHLRANFSKSKQMPYYFYKMALREYYYPFVRCTCGLMVKAESDKLSEGVLTKTKKEQCPVCKEAGLKKCFDNFYKILKMARSNRVSFHKLLFSSSSSKKPNNISFNYLSYDRLPRMKRPKWSTIT